MEQRRDENAEAPRERRIGRVGWTLLALGGVLALLLAAIWLERRPLVTRYIDRTLARRGVPARYTIADLGLGRQRLTNVVIGDPRTPDLTADWVETRVGYGFHGPALDAVRAGRVRIRGRLVDGRVSLGTIDRLLPAPSGKPFALPKLDVDVADARLRLATPAGPVALGVAGRGRLDDGFRGTLAVAAERLTQGDCTVAGLRARMRVTIAAAAPRLAGPVSAAAIACADTIVVQPRATLDVALGAALDRWRGSAALATRTARTTGAAARALSGTLTFAGDRRATGGAADLAAAGATTRFGSAARAWITGRYAVGGATRFDGRLGLDHAAAAPRLIAGAAIAAPAGTPVAPLAKAMTRALRAASRDVTATVDLAYAGGIATVRSASATSASGAAARLTGGGITVDRRGIGRIDAALSLAGGGLPGAAVDLRRSGAGAPITGTATLTPYAAGGARLALTPVRFTAAPGVTRVTTVATLSGPLGDGRVEELALPLDLRWTGRALAIDPACAPLSFRSLVVGGLVLQPARLALCPTGVALVRIADGRVDGGASIAAPRLVGRLGTTPVTLAARGAALRLSDRKITVDGLAARLGNPDRVTRLDVGRLEGRATAEGLTGRFADAAGQIGNVPLLLSNAAGQWSLAGGALALDGTLTVADAAAAPRFNPLAARDVALSLRNGAIHATGTLVAPTGGERVADVTIDHALAAGRGGATLAVPGLTFTKDFQPDRLTRLTFGVIADVRGTVTGQGRIDWSPAGVTSTGTFATTGTDLAAAFGPVTGLAGTLRFTDLLALESAPHQVATVASVNPGIAVTDGTVTYQLLRDTRVQVEGARWPFAGGTLTLDPTLLDFSAPRERRLTFHVAGAAADQFLQQFQFDNINATGVFDGVLPMIFDESGGRIANGNLTARAGGGSLAYVGDLTQKDLGFWGNLAFQSLKSLRYRSLDVRMNGPLAGEMVTDVRFAGVSQGAGAKSNFLIRRLQKLPFVFNIRIRAPFRGLIDSVQSFYDPSRLVQRNLQTLLREQAGAAPEPIQPPANETVP